MTLPARSCPVLLSLLMVLATPLAAQVGSEFQVNTWTTSSQRNPSTAMDSDGDFVVTWNSRYQDGSGYGVFGQRFNEAGVAQGSEFQVNTWTTSDQRFPSAAMDSDGDFVITWHSYGQDGSSFGVFGQRFNASGVPQGSEFQVNTWTTARQREPSAAMDSDGDFVVTWSSQGQDGSLYGIFGQRFNAAGVAQGSEFQVNTWTTSQQTRPSAAMDSDGDFVVTWTSYQDGSGYGVFGKRFNAAGVAQGSEFQVNTWTTSYQILPSAAMDSDGDFVVTWNSRDQDGSNDGVFGQRFNAAGVAQGSEFQVNTWITSYQREPSAAMDSDGDFVVSWMSRAQDGSDYGVFGRRFNAAGVAQGSEFQVNTWTTSAQGYPAAAMDSDGDFVVTWQSDGQDGSAFGTFAALSPPATGTIILAKQTTPDGSSQSFTFNTSAIDPDPATTSLTDGQTATFPDVPENTYRVDETIPPGWTLTSIDCAVDTGSDDTAAGDATGVSIVVNAGQTVTCTFNNRQLMAGLSITKTLDTEEVRRGEIVMYTITVANSGPDPVLDAVVTDTFSEDLINVTWTCSGSGGGTCTAAGSGDINDLADLPVNATVVYTVTATVDPSAIGPLENTANVSAPGFGGTNSDAGTTSAAIGAALAEIPTANAWTLMVMTMLLAVAGLAFMRRM